MYPGISMVDVPFEEESYPVIWSNWGNSYLDDEHVVTLGKKAYSSLTADPDVQGVWFTKETIRENGDEPILYEEQHMIIRTFNEYVELWKKAGLKIVKYSNLQRFRGKSFPCQMFALQADIPTSEATVTENLAPKKELSSLDGTKEIVRKRDLKGQEKQAKKLKREAEKELESKKAKALLVASEKSKI